MFQPGFSSCMCAERVTIRVDLSTQIVSLSMHIILEADPGVQYGETWQDTRRSPSWRLTTQCSVEIRS
jgi:hypothetical protein